MKYVKNIPPTDKDLRNSLLKQGWKKIKEPSNLPIAILMSVPFMFLCGAISYIIVLQFTDIFANILSTGSFSITIRLDYILFAFLLILSHERIHAVFIPNFLRSDDTYFGIRPWGGFVYTTQKLGKARFLLISVAPFVIISVLLPIILGLLNLLNGVIAALILLNAFASSVDILSASLILFQVPNGAMIVNNGFETYYK